MTRQLKTTVIGGGNGGFATAADLKIRGFDVTLYEFPEFYDSIKEIDKLGGINLEVFPSSGLTGGFANLNKITTDIEEALKDADVIFIVTPAYAHDKIAKVCTPYFKNNQIVVLSPGNFGASIYFYNIIKKAEPNKKIYISELECMMYACRKKDATTVWVRGYKHNLGIAAFPAIDTDYVLKKVQTIYPTFVKRNNVLETGLSNANSIVHVPILLFNLGFIDNKMDVLMYYQAFTKSVGSIVDKLDEERMGLNKTGLVKLEPMASIVKGWYEHQGAKGNNVYELNNSNPIYFSSKLPTSLSHRYITEDVPYGLIPMYKIAKRFNQPYFYLKAVVDFACVASGINLYENARDLETLGLNELSGEQLLEYINYGV